MKSLPAKLWCRFFLCSSCYPELFCLKWLSSQRSSPRWLKRMLCAGWFHKCSGLPSFSQTTLQIIFCSFCVWNARKAWALPATCHTHHNLCCLTVKDTERLPDNSGQYLLVPENNHWFLGTQCKTHAVQMSCENGMFLSMIVVWSPILLRV